MKKLIGLFVFALVLSVGMLPLSYAKEMDPPSSETMVKGELLRIDGDFYVVKEGAGARKETRLHVDQTSKLDGTFKEGDKIEATATEKGHAVSIRHAQLGNQSGK